MGVHKTGEELREELKKANELIEVGAKYYHYKHPEDTYTISGLIIIEADDSVGVLYSADYDRLKGITFVRPLDSFIDQVEVEGKLVNRFSKV